MTLLNPHHGSSLSGPAASPPRAKTPREACLHPARQDEPAVHKHPEYTRQRVWKMLERLGGVLHSEQVEPAVMEHCGPVGREPADRALGRAYAPVARGFEFGPPWSTHWFRLVFAVPAGWRGRTVRLDWMSHCEAMIWRRDPADSGGGKLLPLQGINPMQTEALLLPEAQGGESVELYLEVACNDLLGNGAAPGVDPPGLNVEGFVPRARTPFFVERCRLFAVNEKLEAIHHDLRVLCQLEADRTPAQHTANVGQPHPLVRPALDNTWSGRLLMRLNAFCNVFRPEDPQTWDASRRILQGLLACGNASIGHELTAIGHNHIDTAWLWPLEETHRKVLRSWTAQMRLMDRFPSYRFACSQAYQYAELGKSHPEVLKAIQHKARAGQWQPVGGTWIEPDCNLPAGESYVRQFLYGQQFFESTFGKRCREFWNPDVFGYHAQLPQVMRHCGVDRFLTQKLSWNRFTSPPHHTFFWRGIDGSEVLTHFPPADTYNGTADVAQLRYHAANYKDADRSDQALYLFGFGDGGGGATPAMVETLMRTEDLLGVPRTSFRAVDEFFDRLIERSSHLPTVVGEMYFELHRGTYTSQAMLKRLHRRGEVALFEAELALVADESAHGKVRPADREALSEAWKTLLLNEFHDILTGSCTHEVAQRAQRDLASVVESAERVRDRALGVSTDPAERNGHSPQQVIWNPSMVHRREVIADAEGSYAMHQAEPLSAATPVRSSDAVRAEPMDGGWRLSNGALSVTIGAEGTVVSLVERSSGRELLESPAGLRVYHDRPNLWDAWDIDPFAYQTPEPTPIAESVELTCEHPLRAEVTVRFALGGSDRLVQRYRLDAEQCAVRIDHDVDWSARHRLLRYELPTAIVSPHATFESPFGLTQRPTHANTAGDVAMYEVPGQRFVNLLDHGLGVSLLADCKYGYSARGGVLGVSLLRGPTYPDPLCDIGRHTFTLMLEPHAGPWDRMNTFALAERLSRPMLPASSSAALSLSSLLRIEGPVAVSAVKPAERGGAVIVRLYEPVGRACEARVSLSWPHGSVQVSNGLEDALGSCEVDERGAARLSLRAFEVVTLRFEPKA